jgi:hypothetical protein
MAHPRYAIQILEELQDELKHRGNILNNPNGYYAIRGRVEDALSALKLEHIDEKHGKYETDAS